MTNWTQDTRNRLEKALQAFPRQVVSTVMKADLAAALAELDLQTFICDEWREEAARCTEQIEELEKIRLSVDSNLPKEDRDFKALYHELLYEVCKFPGESRHETARRYIYEREHRLDEEVADER